MWKKVFILYGYVLYDILEQQQAYSYLLLRNDAI